MYDSLHTHSHEGSASNSPESLLSQLIPDSQLASSLGKLCWQHTDLLGQPNGCSPQLQSPLAITIACDHPGPNNLLTLDQLYKTTELDPLCLDLRHIQLSLSRWIEQLDQHEFLSAASQTWNIQRYNRSTHACNWNSPDRANIDRN